MAAMSIVCKIENLTFWGEISIKTGSEVKKSWHYQRVYPVGQSEHNKKLEILPQFPQRLDANQVLVEKSNWWAVSELRRHISFVDEMSVQ